MRKVLFVAALGVFTVFAQNTRPVLIAAPPAGEASLQTILDGIYGCTGCVSATANQSTAGFWDLAGNPPVTTGPVLKATYAAASDAVGLYTTTSTLIDIFTGIAGTGTTADVQFNLDGTITIYSTPGNCSSGYVNCGTFSGISQGGFGFYMTGNGATYYTQDYLNPKSTTPFPTEPTTQARALSYVNPVNDRWAMAFEDGTDFDYNDRVISVESITAVPEPVSLIVFGTVLALCATKLRRMQS